MQINIVSEQLVTLTEAAKLLPDRPSSTTMWRWSRKGVGGKVLETITIGGKVYTSVEALQRFATCRGGNAPQSDHRSPAARERAIRKAEQELADAGI